MNLTDDMRATDEEMDEGSSEICAEKCGIDSKSTYDKMSQDNLPDETPSNTRDTDTNTTGSGSDGADPHWINNMLEPKDWADNEGNSEGAVHLGNGLDKKECMNYKEPNISGLFFCKTCWVDWRRWIERW